MLFIFLLFCIYLVVTVSRMVQSSDIYSQRNQVFIVVGTLFGAVIIYSLLSKYGVTRMLDKGVSIVWDSANYGLLGNLNSRVLLLLAIIMPIQYVVALVRIIQRYSTLKKINLIKKKRLNDFYEAQNKIDDEVGNSPTVGNLEESQSENQDKLPWKIKLLPNKMDWNSMEVMNKLANSMDTDDVLYWHDATQHMCFMEISEEGVERYAGKANRNDGDRRRLKSLIYPLNEAEQGNGYTDRTHLIPISVIGTEMDERVVVFFDSKLNRNQLNAWEKPAKEYMVSHGGGYWFVLLEYLGDGRVRWMYRLFSTQMNLVNEYAVTSELIYEWES